MQSASRLLRDWAGSSTCWRVGALLDGVRREHREREADDDQDNRDDRQNHRISNVCDVWSIPVWATADEFIVRCDPWSPLTSRLAD
jgi:hypothetical protein